MTQFFCALLVLVAAGFLDDGTLTFDANLSVVRDVPSRPVKRRDTGLTQFNGCGVALSEIVAQIGLPRAARQVSRVPGQDR